MHIITWSRFCRQIRYINRRLHAFDIWSSNRYRTQACNVIHTMSVKTGPTKLTTLKFAFNFIFASMNKHAAFKASYWFVQSAGKTKWLFIHEEWDSHGIIYISHKRPSTCETNMAASEVSRNWRRLLIENRYFCEPYCLINNFLGSFPIKGWFFHSWWPL